MIIQKLNTKMVLFTKDSCLGDFNEFIEMEQVFYLCFLYCHKQAFSNAIMVSDKEKIYLHYCSLCT